MMKAPTSRAISTNLRVLARVFASSSSLSGKRLAFRGRAGIPQEWHQSQAVPGRFEVSAAELIDGPEHGRSFPAAGFHENLSHWIAS